MNEAQLQDLDRILSGCTEHLDFVIVPGLHDSGPEHWQSYWHQRYPHWKRVTQSSWAPADIDRWISATARTLEQCDKPAILIGHSMGALASFYLAHTRRDPKIAAVMLVAPAEPMRFELEDRIQPAPIPVPSLVVASRNDPLLHYDRAQYWADAWGSDFTDIGEAGHINAEAGFGPWHYGMVLVARLAKRTLCASPDNPACLIVFGKIPEPES